MDKGILCHCVNSPRLGTAHTHQQKTVNERRCLHRLEGRQLVEEGQL